MTGLNVPKCSFEPSVLGDTRRMSIEGLVIRNNPEARRYEAVLNGQVGAYVEYNNLTGARMLTHTEVLPALEGQGVGSRLVQFALEDTRAQNLSVIPMCPFVTAYIQRHMDEYGALIHPMHRRIFGL